MRFCDSRGKGGQKSKDSPCSLVWFPVPDSLLVVMSGLDWRWQCQHQHCASRVDFKQGCLPNSCLVSCFESITSCKSTGTSLCLSPRAQGSPITSSGSETEVIRTCTKGPRPWPSVSHLFPREWRYLLWGTHMGGHFAFRQGQVLKFVFSVTVIKLQIL